MGIIKTGKREHVSRVGSGTPPNSLIRRVRRVGKVYGFSKEQVEGYIDGLYDSYDPQAYRNVSDVALAKDMRIYVREVV